MATRRFCDLCDQPMQPQDDEPFIRHSPLKDIQIALIVTNQSGGVVNDLCNSCKVELVLHGLPNREQRKVIDIETPPDVAPVTLHGRSAGGSGGAKPIYERSLREEPTSSSQPQTETPTEETNNQPEGT